MPKLFNHSHFNAADYEGHDADKYADMVANGTLHSARVLPCTTPEDTIQLDPRLQDIYPYMTEHLEEVGLETAGEVIWDVSPEVAADLPDHKLSVYLFGPEANAVRPDEARLEATDRFNNKNEFIAYCLRQAYPVPDTLIVNAGMKPDPELELPLPVYVKAARSAVGVSIYRAANREGYEKSLRNVGDEYQIQAEVPNTLAFLNVQYRAIGGQAVHFATTEQILNGFAYSGTRFPSSHTSRALTDPLANELVDEGLGEVFAFDVAVTPDQMSIIECNARWNASTYSTIVANRLGIAEWTTYNLDTELDHPKDIKLDGLAYDPKEETGVIIVNSGFMASNNQVSIMLAGPLEVRKELGLRVAERIKQRTPASIKPLKEGKTLKT